MENILVPAIVAGVVFVVFLMLLLKATSSNEDERKKTLLGKMLKENQEEASLLQSDTGNVKLLKDAQGAGESFFFKLPGIKTTCDMLVKAGLWHQRFIFLLASVALFFLTASLLKKIGFFGIAIAFFIAYFGP